MRFDAKTTLFATIATLKSPRPIESAVVCALAALFVGAAAYPAFGGYWFAEDVSHWGSYETHGRSFFAAVFSAHDTIFFRPAPKAWGILSHLLLPREALAFHLRNWLLVFVACLCLYLVMDRLVASRSARLVGVTWFAASKAHLAAVGFVIVADSLFSVIHSLLCIYFLLRYLESKSWWDLMISIGFFALTAGSRDYGIGLIAVVALGLALWRRKSQPLDFRPLLGYGLAGGVYLWLRFSVVASAPPNSLYSLDVDLFAIGRRVAIFWGNIWNMSLGQGYESGLGSFLDFFGPFSESSTLVDPATYVYVALGTALLGFTILRSRSRGAAAPAAMWAVAFSLPTFLIHNVQVYYILEPMAALALLLSIVLDGIEFRRPYVFCWGGVLALAAVSAVLHGQNVGVYPWRYCSDQAEATTKTILAAGGANVRSINLVAENQSRREYWLYTLTANGNGPFLPFVFRNPGLAVHFGIPESSGDLPHADLTLIERDGVFRME